MTEERPRAGRKRSEAARKAILDAALALLCERPYGQLTIDALASTAGVGKQTIYRWWSTKADVVLEALTEQGREIGVPETGSLEGDLRTFLARTFRLLRGARGTGLVLRGLMAEAQLDGDFAARFGAFVATRRAVLEGILARHGERDGVSRRAVVDMLYGAMWYRLLLDHGPLDDATAGRLATLAVAALSSG
jgi:AcrR family transcriptional regulator